MKNASPTEDERRARHARILGVDYPYGDQPRQDVAQCNLCGGHEFVVLTHRDRYGYPAQASGCRRCGLVFLDPRLTAEAYKQFYIDVYRPLVSAYHGRQIDALTIQDEQRDYAVERGNLLAPFVRDSTYRSLLDIGGSTGVVAHAWATRYGVHGTVIDPSPLEIEQARLLNLETVTAIVEDWDAGGRTFDMVVMCQTVDHLLDITKTLDAVRAVIDPAGVFFVDIVDFRAAYLRKWSVEEAIKIDHPYYLTESTIEAYLRRAGFDIVRVDYASDYLHVGYVCRPCLPDPGALPQTSSADALWREIRFVQNTTRG